MICGGKIPNEKGGGQDHYLGGDILLHWKNYFFSVVKLSR
jgi:hypothetical protein